MRVFLRELIAIIIELYNYKLNLLDYQISLMQLIIYGIVVTIIFSILGGIFD